jgi:hypothetical protein
MDQKIIGAKYNERLALSLNLAMRSCGVAHSQRSYLARVSECSASLAFYGEQVRIVPLVFRQVISFALAKQTRSFSLSMELAS